MSYTITDDDVVLDANGYRLPRTEQARLLVRVLAKQSAPVSLYMMADVAETVLKVGIAENVTKRRYENERDFQHPIQVLHTTVAVDRMAAGEIERSIHRFLIGMGRGPVFKTEYFKLFRHDAWLIRRILLDMPVKAAPAIFNLLTSDYIPLIRHYPKAPAYVTEEIKLHFGSNVAYHAGFEFKYLNATSKIIQVA